MIDKNLNSFRGIKRGSFSCFRDTPIGNPLGVYAGDCEGMSSQGDGLVIPASLQDFALGLAKTNEL